MSEKIYRHKWEPWPGSGEWCVSCGRWAASPIHRVIADNHHACQRMSLWQKIKLKTRKLLGRRVP